MGELTPRLEMDLVQTGVWASRQSVTVSPEVPRSLREARLYVKLSM